jgi:hypothetical protein
VRGEVHVGVQRKPVDVSAAVGLAQRRCESRALRARAEGELQRAGASVIERVVSVAGRRVEVEAVRLAVGVDVARDLARELARERGDLRGRRPHEVEKEERPLGALVDEDTVGQQGVKVDVGVERGSKMLHEGDGPRQHACTRAAPMERLPRLSGRRHQGQLPAQGVEVADQVVHAVVNSCCSGSRTTSHSGTSLPKSAAKRPRGGRRRDA